MNPHDHTPGNHNVSGQGADPGTMKPGVHITDGQAHLFDARGIAKRFRHAAIFGALDALYPGETMRFVNDHDPLPLLEQIAGHYGDAVHVHYVERQPEQVVIHFTRR